MTKHWLENGGEMSEGVISFYVQENYHELVIKKPLHNAVEKTLAYRRGDDSPSVTVMITDDEHLKEMNQRYRGINKPTDVLAFEMDFTDPDLDSRYLGDVVISYQQALKQAETRGHQVEEELQLLVVHGVLHLLGFDHDSLSRKEEMWSLQSQVLRDLGLTIEVEDV
ncbi:MAG: rRNA maturation RNase YbeY [Anaerolineales bacterium]